MILHIVYTSKYSHVSKFMKIIEIHENLRNEENSQFLRSGRHLGIAIDQNSRNSVKIKKIN